MLDKKTETLFIKAIAATKGLSESIPQKAARLAKERYAEGFEAGKKASRSGSTVDVPHKAKVNNDWRRGYRDGVTGQRALGASMTFWNVYLEGKKIDSVPYVASMDADEVKRSLVDHDGYDPGIYVIKVQVFTVRRASSPQRALGADITKVRRTHAAGATVPSHKSSLPSQREYEQYGKKKATYEVIVSNMGTVLRTSSLKEAHEAFREYVTQSRTNYGRAAGENVEITRDGEPLNEYVGTQHALGADITKVRRTHAAGATVPSHKSSLPSQREYEQYELKKAIAQESQVEKAPLADRKAAAAEFFESMRDTPQTVGERVEWLLAGNYGKGSHMRAQQVLKSPRMNRRAALTQMVGIYEWQSPGVMSRAAWKKLTKPQQKALDAAVDEAIRDAEKNED